VRQLQDACREAHDDADDLRTENVKLLAVIENMKQRENLWRAFLQSKPELLARASDGPPPSLPTPVVSPSDFVYESSMRYPAATSPHQFSSVPASDYMNAETTAQNYQATYQSQSGLQGGSSDRSDFGSFVAYAQAESQYNPPHQLRLRTEDTDAISEPSLADLTRLPPTRQGFLRIPPGSVSSSSSPALPSPPALYVPNPESSIATPSLRSLSPGEPSPPQSSAGQPSLNNTFTNLSLFGHSMDDMSLDFFRGQQSSPFDWSPSGLSPYSAVDGDVDEMKIASDQGMGSSNGLQLPRNPHRRATSETIGMDMYPGFYASGEPIAHLASGMHDGSAISPPVSIPTPSTRHRHTEHFAPSARGLVRSHSRRHTFPVSPISPESPEDEDEEGEMQQKLSNTLAVIKAQAFGTVRKTRTKTKRTGADAAANVAMEVLRARALGLGLDMGSTVGITKRRRMNQDS
jgi:hypothetical protein